MPCVILISDISLKKQNKKQQIEKKTNTSFCVQNTTKGICLRSPGVQFNQILLRLTLVNVHILTLFLTSYFPSASVLVVRAGAGRSHAVFWYLWPWLCNRKEQLTFDLFLEQPSYGDERIFFHSTKLRNVHLNHREHGVSMMTVHLLVPVGAVVGAPFVVSALGFTSAGIAAGSFASWMMSTTALANGGSVLAGSVVSVLQSIGNPAQSEMPTWNELS